MKKFLSFGLISCLMLLANIAFAQTTFVKVTGTDQLVIGAKYIIVGTDGTDYYAMGIQRNNNRGSNLITVNENSVSVQEASLNTDTLENQAFVLTLGAGTTQSSYYTLYDAVNSGYLYAASSSGNQMKTQATNNANGEWNITFNGGVCSIVAEGSTNRNVMQFNKSNSPKLFSCYASATQTAVEIYVDESSLSSDPAMTIAAPANNSMFYASSVEASVIVRNFELGTDGKIKYTVDEGEAQYSETATFTISNLADGDHSVVIELVDMSGNSLATPISGTVNFTTDADFSTLITIAEIQGTEDTNAQNGNEVATRGVVTAKTNYGFYIQSSMEANSGLYIYSSQYLSQAVIGNEVVVRGTMSEYNGLTEMADLTVFADLGESETVITPIELELNEIAEQYESMLVKVSGTHNGTLVGSAWQITGENGSVYVGNDCYTSEAISGNEYEVTGVLSYSNKENYNVAWVVLPRNANDIVENVEGVVLRITSPTDGTIVMADNVEIEFRAYNFVLGTDGKLKYVLNNGEAQYVTTDAPFVINNLVDGENTIDFELVTMENASLEPAVTVNLTIEARTSGSLTIRDIQYTEDATGDSPFNGQTVTISGTVTKLKTTSGSVKGYYIQDAVAEWSGIYVYSSSNTPAINDNVTVTGAISEYYGLTEISPTTTVNNGATTAIAGLPVEVSQVEEPYESVLVTVEGTCTGITNTNTWTLSNGASIKIYGVTFTPTVGTSYTVTGIVEKNTYGGANDWQVLPRDENDIVAGAAVPSIALTSPANGSTIYSSAVVASLTVYNFEVGTDGNISFSIDDEAEISGTETTHTFTGLTDGEHTIYAKLVNGENVIATATSTFTINLAGPAFTAIRDIQYTEDATGDSPMENQTVWVKGVVTSNFINTPYRPVKGYSIQDEVAAWSGIWVYDTVNNPNIGDSVKFQALVTEYYGLTELKNVSNFEIFDMGVAYPVDVTVVDANSEAYEGCYVRVECVRSVGNTMSYGNWSCVNQAGDTVKYSHNFDRDALTVEKDRNYSVAGIVEYSYGEYYVNYPTVNDVVADCNLAIDEEIANSIDVYPNPTNSTITIANAEGQSVVVLNTLGQIVAEIENASENQTIDLSNLANGTYFVKVNAEVVKLNVVK